MKVVEARNKTINLTVAQPIRRGDSSKDSPTEQLKSVATTFLDPQDFLVPGERHIYIYRLKS